MTSSRTRWGFRQDRVSAINDIKEHVQMLKNEQEGNKVVLLAPYGTLAPTEVNRVYREIPNLNPKAMLGNLSGYVSKVLHRTDVFSDFKYVFKFPSSDLENSKDQDFDEMDISDDTKDLANFAKVLLDAWTLEEPPKKFMSLGYVYVDSIDKASRVLTYLSNQKISREKIRNDYSRVFFRNFSVIEKEVLDGIKESSNGSSYIFLQHMIINILNNRRSLSPKDQRLSKNKYHKMLLASVKHTIPETIVDEFLSGTTEASFVKIRDKYELNKIGISSLIYQSIAKLIENDLRDTIDLSSDGLLKISDIIRSIIVNRSVCIDRHGGYRISDSKQEVIKLQDMFERAVVNAGIRLEKARFMFNQAFYGNLNISDGMQFHF